MKCPLHGPGICRNRFLRVVQGSPFFTLQGEGLRTGVPSTFLRLAGCDLRCHVEGGRFWNCDQPESLPDYDHKLKVFKDTPTKHAEDRSICELAAEIENIGYQELVITGGEPMLQHDNLRILLDQLNAVTPRTIKGVDESAPPWSLSRDPVSTVVTIETNCRHFDPTFARYIHLVSASPKIQAMGQDWASSVEIRVLSQWLAAAYSAESRGWRGKRDVQVKIVCATESEYDIARDIFKFVKDISCATCIVSVADSPHTQHDKLIQRVMADRSLCRLGMQQHKFWGIP